MLSSGMAMSQLEGEILRDLLGDLAQGAPAVSTMTVLRRASEEGIPIHRIDGRNISAVLPLLEQSDAVIAEIRAAVGANMTVIIPAAEVMMGSWSGTGYIVVDPETMNGLYRISGGLNGAVVAVVIWIMTVIFLFTIISTIMTAGSISLFGVVAVAGAASPVVEAMIGVVLITLTNLGFAHYVADKKIRDYLQENCAAVAFYLTRFVREWLNLHPLHLLAVALGRLCSDE